ncbi:MAG: HD domain-containing protein, partial [Candidatus Lokiarchaeota archaeon]|nr:HD domain-containing protein [Candidatus Lokiarchaeota archaeon]
MGTEFKIPNIPASTNPKRDIAKISKEREKEGLEKLKNEEKKVREMLKEKMEKNSNNIPWDHNDHSTTHNERILKKFPSLVNNLDNISFSKEFLDGRELSELDKEILKYSIILHDIGRSVPNTKNHALSSRKLIEKMEGDINPKLKKNIALLAQLHTPSGIKELGGKSLADLVDKKTITKKQAYLASILTIGDALDAGKARVQKNTQGEFARKVINKIKKTYSRGIAKSKLEH